jgi:chromosome segregation ATPase
VSGRGDLRDNMKEDERRRRDEARISALQTQLDETRSLVRELVSRQQRNEDSFKNYEIGLSELRTVLDHHRHEASQGMQARQVEESRVRQQLSELDERIDETTRPIRMIQAHVAEALDAIRRGRDENQDDLRRFEELRTAIDRVAAAAERANDVGQFLREGLDGLRAEHDQTKRDVQKVDDAVRIAEQDTRRRLTEVNQEVGNVDAKIEEVRPIFGQLEAHIEDIRQSMRHVDPSLDELARVDETTQAEVSRLFSQLSERDDLATERIDELRVQQDVSARDLRQTLNQHYERLNERLDTVQDSVRELGFRLNLIDMRIDELADADTRIRREVWHLHEMRTRMRLDQVQAELEAVVDDRRAVDTELVQGSNPPNRRPDRTGGVS